MIDIKFIRENPEQVKQAAKNKNVDVNTEHILEIDKKYRELSIAVQKLREERNKLTDAMKGKPTPEQIEKGKALKGKLEKEENALKAVGEELNVWLYKIPNIPDKSVPVGKDESGNEVIKKWGKPEKFDFKPRDHVELGELLGVIDVKQASRISGSRFAYLKGAAVLLEFALIQYAFDVLTNENTLKELSKKIDKDYKIKIFTPVVPPVIIRPDVFKKMGRLDPQEERYYLQQDNVFLIGSAEHTLGPLHMDEIISEKDLPIRYVGFSTSFRREAGSYGKDIKGILRVHQFDKIEMESFTIPEDSIKEQDFFVTIQEYLMQSLKLPYQVVMICTGEMGTPDARQIDIETWIPSQNKYRETHTSDLMTDYQSRRLNTKVKRKNGSVELVHMNDATVFAIGRTIIAILENYQQENGSVLIPKVLQKYLHFEKITSKKV